MVENPSKNNVYIDFDSIILDYDAGLNKLGLVEQQFYYSLHHQDVIALSEPKANTVEVVKKLSEKYNVIFVITGDFRPRVKFVKKFFDGIFTVYTADKSNLGNSLKTNYLIDTESFLNKSGFNGTLFYLGNGYCRSQENMKVIGINSITDVVDPLINKS